MEGIKMGSDSTRSLREREDCAGSVTDTVLRGREDIEEPTGTYDNPESREVNCDRCGGRGTESEGNGCPRCGTAEKAVSSSLRASGSYRQSCNKWSQVI